MSKAFCVIAVLVLPVIACCSKLFIAQTNESLSQKGTTESPPESVLYKEPAMNSLDLETARNALIRMAEESDDNALKARTADLWEVPAIGEGSPDHPEWYEYYFGEGQNWAIQLRVLTWSVRVYPENSMPWYYYGEFRRLPDGAWAAIETSRRGEGARGGSLTRLGNRTISGGNRTELTEFESRSGLR
jgi:hypothetical protein